MDSTPSGPTATSTNFLTADASFLSFFFLLDFLGLSLAGEEEGTTCRWALDGSFLVGVDSLPLEISIYCRFLGVMEGWGGGVGFGWRRRLRRGSLDMAKTI